MPIIGPRVNWASDAWVTVRWSGVAVPSASRADA